MGLKWNGDVVFNKVKGRLAHNVEASLKHLARTIANKLLVPYPPSSDPGEPPHKRTGELQASVDYRVDERTLHGTVVVDAPHAVYLEFGTARMAARPFFRSTIDEEAGVVRLLLGEE